MPCMCLWKVFVCCTTYLVFFARVLGGALLLSVNTCAATVWCGLQVWFASVASVRGQCEWSACRTSKVHACAVGPKVSDRQSEADMLLKSDAANPDRALFNSDVRCPLFAWYSLVAARVCYSIIVVIGLL